MLSWKVVALAFIPASQAAVVGSPVSDSMAATIAWAREGSTKGEIIDRLRLTPARVAGMVEGLRTLAGLPDPVGDAFAGPWRGRHLDGAALGEDRTLSADVVIVGSGAGGGVCAEILAQAGLSVILVEEGPLRTSRDFNMLEREAYPALYQESAGRKTVDEGIGILQGRAVGGSTLVNWCSSFRTPAATLAHWFIFCCTEEERPRGMGKKTDIGSAGGWKARRHCRLPK